MPKRTSRKAGDDAFDGMVAGVEDIAHPCHQNLKERVHAAARIQLEIAALTVRYSGETNPLIEAWKREMQSLLGYFRTFPLDDRLQEQHKVIFKILASGWLNDDGSETYGVLCDWLSFHAEESLPTARFGRNESAKISIDRINQELDDLSNEK